MARMQDEPQSPFSASAFEGPRRRERRDIPEGLDRAYCELAFALGKELKPAPLPNRVSTIILLP